MGKSIFARLREKASEGRGINETPAEKLADYLEKHDPTVSELLASIDYHVETLAEVDQKRAEAWEQARQAAQAEGERTGKVPNVQFRYDDPQEAARPWSKPLHDFDKWQREQRFFNAPLKAVFGTKETAPSKQGGRLEILQSALRYRILRDGEVDELRELRKVATENRGREQDEPQKRTQYLKSLPPSQRDSDETKKFIADSREAEHTAHILLRAASQRLTGIYGYRDAHSPPWGAGSREGALARYEAQRAKDKAARLTPDERERAIRDSIDAGQRLVLNPDGGSIITPGGEVPFKDRT